MNDISNNQKTANDNAAPVKNKGGRPNKYTPEELEQKINAYFEHIDSSPMERKKVEIYKGETKEYIEYIKRPYILQGLCLFIDINVKTFRNLEKDEKFIPITTHAREKIYNNKMEGATAGIYNSNIVALDLGLKAKEEIRTNNIIIPLNTREAEQINANLSSIYGDLPQATPPGEAAKVIDVTPDD